MSSQSHSIQNPYLGYEPRAVARLALACLQCPDPALCNLACAQNADIRAVMALAAEAACEAYSLRDWVVQAEAIEAARLCDALVEAYN